MCEFLSVLFAVGIVTGLSLGMRSLDKRQYRLDQERMTREHPEWDLKQRADEMSRILFWRSLG